MRSSTEEITNSILISLPKPFLNIQGTYVNNFAAFMPMVSGVNIQEAEFQWDFGDGKTGTSTSQSPSIEHTYEQAGTYTVKVLMVSSLLAEPIEASLVVNITPNQSNSILSCGLISEEAIGYYMLEYKYSTIVFAENIKDNKIYYKWEYEDGEELEWKEAVITNGSVVIEDIKSYSLYLQKRPVHLTVKAITDMQNEMIIDKVAEFLFEDNMLTFNSSEGSVKNSRIFIPALKYELKDAVYVWNFGDGTNEYYSTAENPSIEHFFNLQNDYKKEYVVTLTVRSPYLPFKEYSETRNVMIIGDAIIQNATITATPVSDDKTTYKFTSPATANGNLALEYIWDINGQIYNEPSPEIKFKYDEVVLVKLTVGVPEANKYVEAAPFILRIPTPDFSIEMSGGVQGEKGIVAYFEYITYNIISKIGEQNVIIENPHVEWNFDWRFDDRGHVSSDSTSIVFAYGVNENGEHDNTVGRPILQFLTIRAVITGSNLASPITVTKTITLSTK